MMIMHKLQQKCGTRIIQDGKSIIAPIKDRAHFDDILIYSENKNTQIKNTIKWTPMSEDWKNTSKHLFWMQDTVDDALSIHKTMDPRLFELKERLLKFAGEAVCLPATEDDLDNLLEYGQFWIGNNVKFMKGVPSQCHRNASRLWESNKDKCRICTGYALSDDGMWRQHSWCIWNKARSNQIVETTLPRILYYGFAMTDEECEKFAYDNM